MSTELLLLSDIPDLGQAGDVVKVAPGYARNYLLPKDLAAPVSPQALRRLEKLRKEREEQTRLRLAEANAKAAKLTNASVTLRAKTVDGTRLYGSISAADIAAAIETENKVTVDKSQIELPEPIKETGTFDISIVLHDDVKPVIKVWVVED
ncbi:MAG TPA: 50S ribosomal protein L9 [Kiritimatiellia bacterium]|jgi:large subunit ribosomal protein L9|nr:50S ribosomal protein L9 [Kiritimatiellia bacterium]HOR97002.1 50S ribosomal protein L9 [Kiritimatiellia bacterium]HPC49049.1 50S ribosomal protein L9 [Kiritimatiellia bacterium]HPK37581.1 50S ribosomal protein L9 [Kiritimatiellia bacterium]HPW75027.1 50S ribosomal protein L9 [Kiritimatiellia bacterium]